MTFLPGDVLKNAQNRGTLYLVCSSTSSSWMHLDKAFIEPKLHLVMLIGRFGGYTLPLMCNTLYKKGDTTNWVTEEGLEAAGFEHTGVNLASALQGVEKLLEEK